MSEHSSFIYDAKFSSMTMFSCRDMFINTVSGDYTNFFSLVNNCTTINVGDTSNNSIITNELLDSIADNFSTSLQRLDLQGLERVSVSALRNCLNSLQNLTTFKIGEFDHHNIDGLHGVLSHLPKTVTTLQVSSGLWVYDMLRVVIPLKSELRILTIYDDEVVMQEGFGEFCEVHNVVVTHIWSQDN